MKAIRVQSDDYVDYTPPADVVAGSVVVQIGLLGIAERPLPAGKPGALAVHGVFDVDKASPGSITAGQTVYWDNVNEVATTSATDNVLMGKAVRSALSGTTKVRVLLSQ
jgi:predicted RecA/RadA family phage recombinase